MRIGTQLNHLSEIDWLSSLGVDVFLVCSKEFSTKTNHSFPQDELADVVSVIHRHQKKCYLLLNAMIHEEHLPQLRKYLSFVKSLDMDAIVAFDWTLYPISKSLGLEQKLIYQPSTLTTNLYDPWFYESQGIKGLTIAREITLDSISAIVQNNHALELSLVGHGYAPMFYSYRPLITLFDEENKTSLPSIKGHELFSLQESSREDTRYPIYEDAFGTHIFREKKLESFNEIQLIRPYLSDFFIDRFLLSDEELTDSIAAYQNPKRRELFRQKHGHEYDSGFYYRKTNRLRGDE